MTRRMGLVAVALAVLLAAAATGLVLAGQREVTTPPHAAPAPSLALVVVRGEAAAFAAVVGSTGRGRLGAIVVPTELTVTIPGQGDGTVGDALDLPGRQAATAIANLLGVWIDHHAEIPASALAAVVDRVGVEAGGAELDERDVLASLETPGRAGTIAFELVLEGLLRAAPGWEAADLGEADDPTAVAEALTGAAGVDVVVLPAEEGTPGIVRADPEAVRETLVAAFGGPDREVVSVIVLNGSGVPGVGEIVAERIVPGGFRIVVNENASTFDHEETLVVVGSADDVPLGERVRDLLGVGSVSVSVSSGIAPVTVVVGKDLTSGG